MALSAVKIVSPDKDVTDMDWKNIFSYNGYKLTDAKTPR